MTKIKVRNNESFEQALRRFNNEVKKAGIIDEVRNRSFYRKPSEINREKRKALLRKFHLERKNNSK